MPTLTAAETTATTGERFAVFDVDRTLLRGSSLARLGRALGAAGLVTRTELSAHLAREAVFAARGLGPTATDRLRASLLRGVAGREQGPLQEVATVVGAEVVGSMYSGARWLLAQHRAAGHRCVLLSSSPQELVDAIAAVLEVDVAAGTVAEVVDGRYTGRLVGSFCHGEGKVHRLREVLGPVDLGHVTAYADSASDLPLLRRCGSPVAVNPDRRLRAVARDRGWPVLDLA